MYKRFQLSIIIPTKDRYKFLHNSLITLSKNSKFFKEVLIIDSSNKKIKLLNKNLVKNFKYKIKIFDSKPSISIQRNIGLRHVCKRSNYVMFLDDDITFYNNAFYKIVTFIKKNTNYAGIGFNLIIKKKENWIKDKLKKNKLIQKLNLYSEHSGDVTKSGWHTKAINLKKTKEVKWLPTQAVIYKKKILTKKFFASKFGEYSYLEDLDFSYSISKIGKLVICHSAKYFSNNNINRDSFFFGSKEIINRSFFIKRQNLSKNYFLLGCILLTIKNFFLSIFMLKPKLFLRSVGNISGIINVLIK